MKMKQSKRLEKYPPYKHTCSCQDGEEFLQELPESTTCVDPKYYKRIPHSNRWIDITEQVDVKN